MTDDDRTVHAVSLDGEEQFVRYDRAGKWWIEFKPPRLRPARQVSLGEAVERAAWLEENGVGLVPFYGKSGGRAFDRALKLRLAKGRN